MESHGTLEQYRSILLEPIRRPTVSGDTRDHLSITLDSEVQDKEAKPTSWFPQLKEVVEFEDEDGDTQEVDIGKYKLSQWLDNTEGRESRSPFKNFAIVLRHKYDGPTKSTQLEIQSDGLRGIFQSIGNQYSDIELTDNPIVIPKPFQILFFEREKLYSLSISEEQPEKIRQELKELLRFIHSDRGLQQTITAYDNMVLKENRITRELVWTLYPPMTVVHFQETTNAGFSKEFCGIVTSTEAATLIHSPIIRHKLLYGHHDGTKFGICERKFTPDYISGKFDINRENCKLFPLRLLPHEDQVAIRERLTRRGKKYIDICQVDFRFMHYDGPMILIKEESRFSRGFGHKDGLSERDRTSQRLIIDRKVEGQLSGRREEHVRVSDSLDMLLKKKKGGAQQDQAQTEPDLEISSEDLLICENSLIAFCIREKVWSEGVLVDRLEDILWAEDPFKSLQLPAENKLLVMSLVRGFQANSSSTGYDDVIQGKGRGLVFLLHGSPGLGKTLTAESVAESARRPLYHVTSGQLSTEVGQLEQQLTEIFQLGFRWGAVVLVDEADVLIARRNISDLNRNAIVAVFLRLLEYYQGMLFLTTNRIEDFDEAFHNRIHVTIRYENLKAEERKNIWREHLSKVNNESLPDAWNNEVYDLLSQLETNGRDIRNYTRTAYGFARSNGEALSVKHILTVVRNNFTSEKIRKSNGVLEQLDGLAGRLDYN